MLHSSNSLAMIPEDIAYLESATENLDFLDRDATDLFLVSEEDDTFEDRVIYGFGNTCPLELSDSNGQCRSFKEKLYGCRSCISAGVAKNYLAKHAFDSSRHPSCGDEQLAFIMAEAALPVEETETPNDRRVYRRQVALASASSSKRARSRSPTPRNKSKGFGGGKGKGRGRAVPIGRAGPSTPPNPPPGTRFSTELAKREPQKVSVKVDELTTLRNCLVLATATQKRTIETLKYSVRQMEDETEVFTQARNVVSDLIFRAGHQ